MGKETATKEEQMWCAFAQIGCQFQCFLFIFRIFVFQCFVFPILFMFTILKLGVVNMEIVVSNMETDKISLIRSLTRLLQIYHQVCYHNMANMFPLQNRVITSNKTKAAAAAAVWRKVTNQAKREERPTSRLSVQGVFMQTERSSVRTYLPKINLSLSFALTTSHNMGKVENINFTRKVIYRVVFFAVPP